MGGIIGMIGMIIPPEVIGPGAAVGSQIGPVCVMRPTSELSEESHEEEMAEACEEASGVSDEVLYIPGNLLEASEEEAEISAEVVIVVAPNKVLDNPDVDGKREEEVNARCVVDTKAVVLHVEYKVAVPLNHVMFGVRVQETEEAEPSELSQSQ